MTNTRSNRFGIARRSALTGGALMLAATVGRAATLHVPGDFAQIADAMNAATIGDTIVLGVGTFPANLVFTKSLVLTGAGASRTVLDGGQTGTVLTTTPGVTLTVQDITVRRGKAPAAFGSGGGVLNDGDLHMERCIIQECAARVSGGGLSNANGTAHLVGCLLQNNSATFGGGAIDNNATLILENCTLTNNAADYGGGIINTGQLTITNGTVYQNTAQSAGGIYMHSGTTDLQFSTVYRNDASGTDGGGVLALQGLSGRGTIIAQNKAKISGPDVAGSLVSGGYNLIGDQSGATLHPLIGAGPDQTGNAVNALDPRLDALKDNGGPVPTLVPAANSPAIDKGGPSGFPAWDARGTHRPRNGGSGQLLADVGAVEVGPIGYTATDLRHALQIAAGIVAADGSDSWLNVDTSNAVVDLVDCSHLARKTVGLE